MKTTLQQKFNRTKTALAVGIALFAISEIASAVYVARTSELTATADTAEAGEEAITIDVLANDGQADASTLTIATQPTQGTVSISAGQAIYTPNEGFSGTDTFTYTVTENEWRNGADNNPTVTPYSMTVNATAPIASSYAATDGDGNPVTVNIASGTFAAPGFWNESPIGDGVVGKSWKPSSSVAQLEGCNAGDDAATPISVTMNWSAERRANAAQFNPGSNQFTITTEMAPTPVKVDGDGIVLQIFQDPTSNVTSSTNGAGTITDIAGSVGVGTDSWKFSTVSTWSNLSAADFEAMPITILASTYNSKTWYSSASSFEASVDYSTCQLNTGTATVTITAKVVEEESSGGGGSIDKVALFALGLFGLNALRRRRQA